MTQKDILLFELLNMMPVYLIHFLSCSLHPAGNDYLVNIQNLSSSIFTVVFQSKQANSTENVIFIAEDDIFEGKEYFRLRIVAARFSGQAAALFRVQDGLNNTFVDVHIDDNDCKFRKSA